MLRSYLEVHFPPFTFTEFTYFDSVCFGFQHLHCTWKNVWQYSKSVENGIMTSGMFGELLSLKMSWKTLWHNADYKSTTDVFYLGSLKQCDDC